MRYIVPNVIIDHFGGCLSKREDSRNYYHTGIGDAPIIAKFRKDTRSQYFCIMGRRAKEPQEDELARRLKFGQIANKVAELYNSESDLADLKADFKAQTKIKTLRAFVWSRAKILIETAPEPTE